MAASCRALSPAVIATTFLLVNIARERRFRISPALLVFALVCLACVLRFVGRSVDGWESKSTWREINTCLGER